MREMKDSGIDWIGKIPKSWKVSTIKREYSFQTGWTPSTDKDDYFDGGNIWANISDLKQKTIFESQKHISDEAVQVSSMNISPKGSLMYAFKLSVGAVSFCGCDMYTNEAIATFLPGKNSLDYLYYLAPLAIIKNANENIYGAKLLNQQLIRNAKIILPPVDEQHQIAKYLDENCAKIDAVIARQQEAIEKLKAYKLSVITDAVAPKKEWAKGHLGYLATFKNGLNYNGVSTDAEIKFLGVGDFQHHFRLDNADMFSTLKFNGEMPEDLLLQNGDIVFVRSNGSKELVGRSVLIDNVDYPLTYSGFCIRMRNLRQDIAMNEFLLYCFWSHDFRQNLNRDSRGSNINNLNQELLSKLEVALPSLKIQREIVQYLDQKCVSIENAIRKKRRIVEKLHEYKKSLIYEVVTGKREV